MTTPTEQEIVASLKHVAESLSGGVFDDPLYAAAADLIERLVKERDSLMEEVRALYISNETFNSQFDDETPGEKEGI